MSTLSLLKVPAQSMYFNDIIGSLSAGDSAPVFKVGVGSVVTFHVRGAPSFKIPPCNGSDEVLSAKVLAFPV